MNELHHWNPELQHRYMVDAPRNWGSAREDVQPIKSHQDLLGNAVAHLHWHMIVRDPTDPHPKHSIWEGEFPKGQPSDEDFDDIASAGAASSYNVMLSSTPGREVRALGSQES